MQELGVDRYIEIGPGKVLSGFMRKIDKSAQVLQVDDEASYKALLEEVN